MSIVQDLLQALGSSARIEQAEIAKTEVSTDAGVREIILPAGMSYMQAAAHLEKLHEDLETIIKVVGEVPCLAPQDAGVQFVRAIKEIYGHTASRDTATFFGPVPPRFLSVTLGNGDAVQVPMGNVVLPFMGDDEEVNIALLDGVLLIQAQVKKRNAGEINRIIDRVKELLATDSIYFGHTVTIPARESGFDLIRHAPKWVKPSAATTDLFLNEAERTGFQASVVQPVVHFDKLSAAGHDPTSKVLFSGQPGTGKSLAAGIACNVANKNGWAALIVERAEDLANVLRSARTLKRDGGKVLIVVEDIDTSARERSVAMNDLLNSLDGPNKELVRGMVIIMTTNFASKLDATMLRRVFVLNFGFPDAEVREGMFRHMAASAMPKNEDISGAVEASAGFTGAFINQAVNLAVRFATTEGNLVTGAVLENFVRVLRPQRDAVYELAEESKGQRIEEMVANAVREALAGQMAEVVEGIEGISNNL